MWQSPEGGQTGIKGVLVICDYSSEYLQDSFLEVIRNSKKKWRDF